MTEPVRTWRTYADAEWARYADPLTVDDEPAAWPDRRASPRDWSRIATVAAFMAMALLAALAWLEARR